MAQEDIKIKVGLKNEASGPLKELAQNIKSFADEFKNATPRVEGAAATILRFGTGVAVGNLVTLAARKILREFAQQMRDVVGASNEMASAMIGLSSVAAAFGVSQQEARDSARSLAEDGLMSVSEAGEGLKNLLATGFNLEQAINLMDTFKDAAAFNRQGTLEFGQAIVGATQGIKNQNSIMVDNVGITKNLSVIMKEAGLSVSDMGRVSSDASVRLALYNGLLREGAIFAGDAARAAMTLQGAQSTLKTSVFNLQATIGQALAPALLLTTSAMIDQVNTIQGALQPVMIGVAQTLVSVVTNVRILAATLKTILAPAFYVARAAVLNVITMLRGFANVLSKIIRLDFRGAVNAWMVMSSDMADTSQNAVNSIVDNFKGYIPAITEIAEQGAEIWNRISTEGLQGFSDIAREALEQLPAGLSEGAKKMIEQIEKEIKRFAKSMESLIRNFDDNMRDLVISHKEKVDDIKDQIEDERKSMADAIEDVREKYKDMTKQMEISAQDRVNSLKVQLDRELAKGKYANKEKIKALEDMILRETRATEEQIKEREKFIEEEIQEVKDKHQEKLDELQKELETEMALQVEHADVFAQFKDAIAEDDIERLKRKFKEERELMIKEHAERLAEIKKQAQAEAQASGSYGQPGGGTSGPPSADPNKLYSASELIGMGYGGYRGWNNPEAGYNFRDTGGSGKWTGMKEGGIVTKPTAAIIGEAGPEAVIPLSNPQKMREVMSDIGGVGGINIAEMPVTIVNNEVDIDILMERIAFAANKQGLI